MLDAPTRPAVEADAPARPGSVRTLTVSVLVMVGLAAVLGVLSRAGISDGWLGWAVLAAAAGIVVVMEVLVLGWRRQFDSGRSLAAWSLLTVAGLLVMVGVVVGALAPGSRHLVLDVAYFVACPFFAIGVLLLPAPRLRDRWEALLDVMDGIAAALGTAVSTLWLLPDDVGHGLSLEEMAHAGAVIGTVGVLVYVIVRQRRPGGIPLRQFENVVLAAVLVTAGAVVVYRASVQPVAFGYALAAACFVLGCLVGVHAVIRPPVEIEGPDELRRRETWATLLPAIPIGLGLISIAWYATQPVPLPFTLGTPMVVLVFVLVVVFLVVRVLAEQQARRLRAAAAAQELESVAQDAWFRTMTADSADAVLLVDLAGRIVVTSPAAERVLEATPDALAGSWFSDHLVDRDLQWRDLLGRAARTPGTSYARETVVRAAGDEARPVEARVTALSDPGGLQGYVVTLRDVSERARLTAALAQQQVTDPLTGLRNRAGFLAAAAGYVDRPSPEPTAVVVLDLERFGIVNDTLGHDSGDDLLRQAAAIVDACASCGGVVVGRVGGDEFAVLVTPPVGTGVDQHVTESVAHLRSELGALSAMRGDGLPMTCHVGYAVRTGPDVRSDDLLRRAEVAVETARQRATDAPVRFDPAEHAARLADVSLEADLRTAIHDGGLVLHYQPVVSLRDGGVVGVEALVRWPHPVAGMIGPDRFVVLAERTGLAVDLGRWVMRQALTDVAALREAAGGNGFHVAVNVSSQEVTAALPDEVGAALDETGARPQLLVVEVTESALFSHPEEARPALDALRARGVTVALDDFGTGYSSLALLARVPVDVLKIDRTFVARVEAQGEEWALVRGVLQMCQSLRLRSVAEGVETEAQADLLRAMGCDQAQGYLFARPLPLDEACSWMRARRTASSTLRG